MGELIVKSALIFSGFIVLLTEILSLFKAINLTALIISWSFFSIILLYFLYKNRENFFSLIRSKKSDFVKKYQTLYVYEKLLLVIITIFVLLLLFQGIIYPPNNWDSLTYHMPRIMYWIGNESVAHFPSHILRHLYQPPFAEYFILNLNLLNGNDYFSNTVQLLYLILTFFSIWLLLTQLAISRFYKILALFIAITIPAVELQATTTKNDIVCSFFILTAIVFCIKTYYSNNFSNFLYLGLAIGLAMLTKGTAYLFLAPILAVYGWLLLIKIIKTKDFKLLLNGFAVVLVILSINISHFTRNYKIEGNILNIDKNEALAFSNQKMDGKLLLSNLLKNVGLHLGYPIETKADAGIRKLHTLMNVPIDNPDTNYYNIKYDGPKENTTNEDLIPNLSHLILFLVSLSALSLICFKKFKENISSFLLILIILSQIILFSAILKWQPWHTRLHIPIFLLIVILISLTIEKSKLARFFTIGSLPILFFSFCFYFLYNNVRPIITNPIYTKDICLSDSRYKKYFAHQLHLYPEYSIILDKIYSSNPKKIGLIISDWEYPFLSDFYYDKLKITAINVNNVTAKIPQDDSNIDVIVSNSVKQNFIAFKGKNYYNQTPDNVSIWFYK
ncbi:ArnT family glycosyltransferase [Flavobacterium cauense]|nr:glycosyltransferase family 39 protein [Flavobacterium cauense]